MYIDVLLCKHYNMHRYAIKFHKSTWGWGWDWGGNKYSQILQHAGESQDKQSVH